MEDSNSNGVFTLESEFPIETIELFDAQGRSVDFILAPSNKLILQQFEKGIYYLVTGSNENSFKNWF